MHTTNTHPHYQIYISNHQNKRSIQRPMVGLQTNLENLDRVEKKLEYLGLSLKDRSSYILGFFQLWQIDQSAVKLND